MLNKINLRSTGYLRRTLSLVVVVLLALFGAVSVKAQQKQEFQNPIFPGFYPDPSICRVGEDYYLITSTFAYFPGVPIFHSKDLVNWTQIGNILDRPEQLNLAGHDVSRGIFAPTISYKDGTFYMVTTLIDRGGNFVVTATNPAGPWSNPHWLPNVSGIDPSLFHDEDGKSYIMYNSEAPDNKPLYDGHRTIRMFEFDLKTMKTVGPQHLLVNGGVDLSKKPVWIEGPHIYKVNGYYYLMAAEGGTSVNHSEVILRSKTVTGPYVPYEKNPILTQRHLPANRPNPVSATGHADLVQTQKGEWWAIFLATRPYDGPGDYYNTGRETFLAPVTWQDGWPIINADHDLVQYSYPVPNLPAQMTPAFPLTGNFTYREDFVSGTLPMYWLQLRTPGTTWYSLSQPKGKLTLQVRPESFTEKVNVSFLARRQQHLTGSASTQLEFQPEKANEFAGLVAFQNSQHHYALGKTKKGQEAVVQLLKADQTVLAEIALSKKESRKPLFLKIEFNRDTYAFYYSTQKGKWRLLKGDVDGKYLSTRVAGGFVGVTLGMYATSHGQPSQNKAAFDWFDYEGKDATYARPEVSQKQ
ncbi:glycoside hydrolase family 43 protein [Rufibacter glacialis]|uniref:Glycoside hydrolase family 43 protein n=1 Tax=Rufibacter glacialis TaxID=1259555 RepID=A0A5M8QC65_9BACT|nr:glycoside hydrolase family 43 protein [Rufibacter glacialis]KAA6432490.1 glycoside hydrolase family 43 protein [Rufibacter glacialis]GGK79135.1 glycoside hydrolase 43 family protein [Rufibacter glacialis]